MQSRCISCTTYRRAVSKLNLESADVVRQKLVSFPSLKKNGLNKLIVLEEEPEEPAFNGDAPVAMLGLNEPIFKLAALGCEPKEVPLNEELKILASLPVKLPAPTSPDPRGDVLTLPDLTLLLWLALEETPAEG